MGRRDSGRDADSAVFVVKSAKTLAACLPLLNDTRTLVVKLRGWVATVDGVALLNALRVNSSVTDLRLTNTNMGINGALLLANMLQENSTITSVEASCKLASMGTDGAVAIAEALKVNMVLRHLNLDKHSFGDIAAAAALAEGLQVNQALTSLSLNMCRVGPDGAQAIARALQVNTVLLRLELGSCGIGPSGGMAFAECLKVNSTLSSLDLEGNVIASAGSPLAEALKANSALTSLNLRKTKLTGETALALADMLKENASLTWLNLRNNVLGADGVQALAQSIQGNTHLAHLDLGPLEKDFPPIARRAVECNWCMRQPGWPARLSTEDQTLLISAWMVLLANPQYETHVKALLEQCDIQVLAKAVDANGRTALNVAVPEHRVRMLEKLHFLSRYEILAGTVHQSQTCVVRFAIDHRAGAGEPSAVALKLMHNHSQFEREVNAREHHQLDTHYVVGHLRTHQGATLAVECCAHGLGEYTGGLLVMPRADRSLYDVIAHEEMAGSDWEMIRTIARQLAEALGHLHAKGLVHGDVKPLNLMRLGERWQLIDLDASAQVGTPAAVKFSSAYVAPELVCVISPSAGHREARVRSPNAAEAGDAWTPCLAHPSQDMWSYGATLFQLCTGRSLWHHDKHDNVSSTDLLRLHEWTARTKHEALALIKDRMARNLVSRLLNKDLSARIHSADQALHHPFLTRKEPSRMPGEPHTSDVFLSYRVWSDKALAEALYDALLRKGLTVFWDKVCLKDGEPWEEGFCDGLAASCVFVPLISAKAMQSTAKLTADSPCDNVLLEHRLALELRAQGLVEKIFPVLVGEAQPDGSLSKPSFSLGPFPQVTPSTVENKVAQHLERLGLGSALLPALSVRETESQLMQHQGHAMQGVVLDAVARVAEKVALIAQEATQQAGNNGQPSTSVMAGELMSARDRVWLARMHDPAWVSQRRHEQT